MRGEIAIGARDSRQRGFTLVELLIVIAVLALLGGVVALAITGIARRARANADDASVERLNNATAYYAANEGKARGAIFAADSSDNDKLLLLVAAGYLRTVPIPQQPDASFLWDTGAELWTLGPESALTPLGSTFSEIGQGLIVLIRNYYAEHGHYPRSWGTYAYTDVGLDPEDWASAIDHVIYNLNGNRFGIRPESGYIFTVQGVDGSSKVLTNKLNWNIWYDDVTQKWYYHSIAPENEVDIATLQITALS